MKAERRRILVVDDEEINLEIIREYLDGDDYELETHDRPEQAWQSLQQVDPPHELIILDRMMPVMNGIEFLRKVKADARLRNIPVIMQTAAGSSEQVREGIEAGAYYYLIKPYEPETLTTIVRAALADIDEREQARRHAAAHIKSMKLLDAAEFRYSTLDDIGDLIEVLASLCPASEQAASGLTELLVNAVEHGNLGFNYDDKKRLRQKDGWEAAVQQRLAAPEYRDRYVSVSFKRGDGELEFVITDQGRGFDWRRYLDFDPLRASDPNGRGIALARLMSFSSLEYRGNGNVAVAKIALPQNGGQA